MFFIELVHTNSFMMFRIYESIHTDSFCLPTKTTSRSLLLITDGTDDRTSAIDDGAKRELQLSIINSKLPCKNLFHRKCVYMLHDQFDGWKKQKCVRTFLKSIFLTSFLN